MSRRAPIGPASSPAELMAAVAHEIGTPMTTILGYAELLAKSVDDEKNRQRAATIVEQVHRVSELTERLLALSRPTGEVGVRPVEPTALVEAGLAACEEALDRRGIRLERRLESAPPVLADPTRLGQAIGQLLLAAIEATPRDGRLRISLVAGAEGVEISACVPDPEGDDTPFRLSLPLVR